MSLPWFVAAIGAAIIWGIHYPLLEHALRRLSLMSVLLLGAIGVVVIAPFFHREITTDLAVFRQMPWRDQTAVAAIIFTSVIATALLLVSITGKNATLASLIEISYPLFVALFSYVLFQQMHLNASVAVGALLVFAGIGVIIWFNP